MFTQSCCLLTRSPLTLDDLKKALASFEVLGRTEAQAEAHWSVGAPAFVLSCPDHPRGRIIVDAIGERWPDAMGDPDDQTLRSAWAMGAFGPRVAPGALERAGTQAWLWRKAGQAIQGHRGFIRVRRAYAPAEDAPAVPEDRDPTAELMSITRVATKLLELDGVRCYFNPNGEAVRPAGFVWQALDIHQSEGELPLDVWSNVRVVRLEEEPWLLMDTVGMFQLGLPDVELCVRRGTIKLETLDTFCRDLAAYLADAGDVISAGDTIEGPDGAEWTALRIDEGFQPPRRDTIRFIQPGAEAPPRFKMNGVQATQMALQAAAAKLASEG